METKEIVTSIIQASLKGKLKESENFQPKFLAEAIITKVEFEKPYGQKVYNKEFIESLRFFVTSLQDDMKAELESTDSKELLLKNLIRGEIVACEKINGFINTLH